MRVLIAVTLIVGWAAILNYALWRVAQDLVFIRYAPEPPLADPDDYDLAPKANQHRPVAQTANDSIEELQGDREQV